eukprot:7325469-Pyramimonas_sp.AAC.1
MAPGIRVLPDSAYNLWGAPVGSRGTSAAGTRSGSTVGSKVGSPDKQASLPRNRLRGQLKVTVHRAGGLVFAADSYLKVLHCCVKTPGKLAYRATGNLGTISTRVM